ncbi:MAG: polyprenyl synthetase family protein [Chloroflexi bacterium]|nr:polyprenyl synthetase family protein [Chloroflexota bacterium]
MGKCPFGRSQWAKLSKNPTLDQYFNQVVSKSGMVFASVTLAGARLGSKDKNILSALFDYGMGIGIGIQIKDDCYDLSKNDLAAGMHTLPLIHALSLDVDPRRDELQTLLKAPLTEVNIESIKSY